ncbi:hypothetical protein [Nocardia sp. NPDC005998]|uniref:hypothetical protein n=1 Tax=Nocardia sp. NPDC005998 TaxID=3156894 RepID=UPI0033B07F2E
MEPVSLGLAAAALLASKFGEDMAKNAGDSAWAAVTKLAEMVTAKFRHDPQTRSAITALVDDSASDSRAVVADRIESAARLDPEFARAIGELVTTARRDPGLDLFVAHAYDDAKQVNIRGDNTGTINIG